MESLLFRECSEGITSILLLDVLGGEDLALGTVNSAEESILSVR